MFNKVFSRFSGTQFLRVLRILSVVLFLLLTTWRKQTHSVLE